MERILEKGKPVLDGRGRPNAGYSFGSAAVYDRRAVRCGPFGLKEWDFYQISDGVHVLQLIIGHVSYAGSASVTLFNVETGERLLSRGMLTPLRAGIPSMSLDAAADSETVFEKGGARIRFTVRDGRRTLSFDWDGASGEIELTNRVGEGVVVNTPFAGKPRCFYYNHKWAGMRAQGTVRFGAQSVTFDGESAFGLLDWGRGVLPFAHEWIWGGLAGMVEGAPLAMNLGHFGDNRFGSENAAFYGDERIKLGTLAITRGKSYMDPWRLEETEGRLSLTLMPVYDNDSETKLLFVDNRCHQMFGRYSGTLALPKGGALTLSGVPGFCEHAENHW